MKNWYPALHLCCSFNPTRSQITREFKRKKIKIYHYPETWDADAQGEQHNGAGTCSLEPLSIPKVRSPSPQASNTLSFQHWLGSWGVSCWFPCAPLLVAFLYHPAIKQVHVHLHPLVGAEPQPSLLQRLSDLRPWLAVNPCSPQAHRAWWIVLLHLSALIA